MDSAESLRPNPRVQRTKKICRPLLGPPERCPTGTSNSRPECAARRKLAALKKSNDQTMKSDDQIIGRWPRIPLDNVPRISPLSSQRQCKRSKNKPKIRRVIPNRGRRDGCRNNHVRHRLNTMMSLQSRPLDWHSFMIGRTAASQALA
jgi:hypothetical protein